jgi:pre-mRNA-splicing factor ATP-dependent RNA helicase DHX16
MPDDKREKAMPDRYVEIDDREKQPHSEQKVWEDARMATAQWNFGARDAKQRLQKRGKIHDYDLLLDDTIDFIQTNQLAGTKGIEGKVTPKTF